MCANSLIKATCGETGVPKQEVSQSYQLQRKEETIFFKSINIKKKHFISNKLTTLITQVLKRDTYYAVHF